MPFLQLNDDGSTVTLDLHGASVHEALDATRRAVAEAARRGRATVRVIHGTSTSDAGRHRSTIKHALRDLLEEGGLDRWVSDAWHAEGHLLLSLDVTGAPDPTPIRLIDVLP